MPGRPLTPLELDAPDRHALQRWRGKRKTAQAMALRARVVLRATDGLANKTIAEELGITRPCGGEQMARALHRAWYRRAQRCATLRRTENDNRRGCRAGDHADSGDYAQRCHALAPIPAQSTRSMARSSGARPECHLSYLACFRPAAAPQRDLQAIDGSLLHREGARGRLAVQVGLYLNPPDQALVLCVDEKRQIQALDRTAPMLPMRPGQIERHTHDRTDTRPLRTPRHNLAICRT